MVLKKSKNSQAGSMRLVRLYCLGNKIKIYNDTSWCLVKATYIPKVCIEAACFCWSADKITQYEELAYVLGKILVYALYLYFVYCSNRVIPGLHRAGKLPGHCHSKNNAEGNGGKYFSESNSFNHSIRKHSQEHHKKAWEEEGWAVEISHISSFSGKLQFSSVKKKIKKYK